MLPDEVLPTRVRGHSYSDGSSPTYPLYTVIPLVTVRSPKSLSPGSMPSGPTQLQKNGFPLPRGAPPSRRNESSPLVPCLARFHNAASSVSRCESVPFSNFPACWPLLFRDTQTLDGHWMVIPNANSTIAVTNSRALRNNVYMRCEPIGRNAQLIVFCVFPTAIPYQLLPGAFKVATWQDASGTAS
jgi:hypothetical protein